MRCVAKGMTTYYLCLVIIVIYYLIYIELRHRGTLPLLRFILIVGQVVLGRIISLYLWLFSASCIFTVGT